MPEVFNEKFIETFIRDYPEVFLGENLALLAQQQQIGGFIPDLIFEDKDGSILIVEVQQNSLDRNHLYRTIEYGHLYKIKHHIENVRLMLFCNEVPSKYIPILDAHKIETKIFTKEHFIKKAKDLIPDLVLLKDTEDSGPEHDISIASILSELNKKRKPKTFPTEGEKSVFYCYPDSRAEKHWKYFHYSLNQLTEIGSIELSDYIPYEVIVSNAFIKILDLDKIEFILEWSEILSSYLGRKEEGDIFLGFRRSPDLFNYDDYLKGFIRKFSDLFCRYQNPDYKTYNIGKLTKDLDVLKMEALYFGNNAAPKSVGVFANFKIEKSFGEIEKRWEEEVIGYNKARGISEEEIFRYLNKVKKEMSEYEFINIHFDGFNRYVLLALKELCIHLRNGHYNYERKEFVFDRQCFKCITKPFQLKEIPRDVLNLTNNYFKHYSENSLI